MSANRRIAKEYTDLQSNPIDNVTIEPDENNVLHWTGIMEGPVGSCYEGGKFKIEATFPLEYPFKAPAIKFLTRIYHPNITQEGLLCIGLLKPDAWKPSIRIEHAEDAIVASIAEQFGKDYNLFRATAQEYVRKVSRFFFQLGKEDMFVLMVIVPSASMRAETGLHVLAHL